MPEVTDIIAANGDVWRVEAAGSLTTVSRRQAYSKSPGVVVVESFPCNWLDIPADVLPRVVEVLKGLVET